MLVQTTGTQNQQKRKLFCSHCSPTLQQGMISHLNQFFIILCSFTGDGCLISFDWCVYGSRDLVTVGNNAVCIPLTLSTHRPLRVCRVHPAVHELWPPEVCSRKKTINYQLLFIVLNHGSSSGSEHQCGPIYTSAVLYTNTRRFQ